MRRTRRALARGFLALLLLPTASLSLGCFAINNRTADRDRAPVVNHGAGATVIRPGAAPPPHPGNLHPREAGYGAPGASSWPPSAHGAPGAAPQTSPHGAPPQAHGAPPPGPPTAPEYGTGTQYGNGTRSGSGGGGGGVAMLGGAEIEETVHVRVNEEPRFLKYLGLPFAALAAPFKYGAEKARGEPEPGPDVPRNDDQLRAVAPTPAPTDSRPLDYDAARRQQMERELAQRGAGPPPAPTPGPTGAPAPRAAIADELAALRRRAAGTAAAPPAPVQTARASGHRPALPALEPPTPRSAGNGTGEVDRDGDGQPDHWLQREAGLLVREAFDENFDGRPDRTLFYGPTGREVVRIEEDTDHDGHADTWTALREGRVVARRVDDDGDGHVDSWSSYRDGVITRLERDANRDGFRDHVAFYEAGRLTREERDDDGDGRVDLVKHYDEAEHVRRVEEDADGNGEMDVVSYYENGRLVRREVLDASVLAPRRDAAGE